MDVIRRAADPGCSRRLQESITAIDHILLDVPRLRTPLKSLFGLADLEHDDDFADLLSVSGYGPAAYAISSVLRDFLRVHWERGKARTGTRTSEAIDLMN